MIAVSVVSHMHGAMVRQLADYLLTLPEVMQVVVTLNVPEEMPLPVDGRVQVVVNSFPKGFGANHNAAFGLCSQPYFCPLNPDIELRGNPFPLLLNTLDQLQAGLVAPRVDALDGRHEDSWRHFPTLGSLLLKALGRWDGRYVLPPDGRPLEPDWVAGMFMLFRSDVFRRLEGFDEGFFLYYEDVDICARLWKVGSGIIAVPAVGVIHDARRDSHRSWRHFRWHLASMIRYFLKHRWHLSRSTQKIA